jgi:septum site-determining protein MinD
MLAVCGGKGGVGKTTTAAGVGAAFAAQHRHTFVVDCDLDMPNLHAVVGTPAEPGVEALAGGAPLSQASHPTRWQGLAAVPATPGADAEGLYRRLPEDRPVLLDCPAGGGPAAAAPLRAADRALVVTTPHPPAVKDALKTAAMARSLDARVAGVVVNRVGDSGAVGDAFDAPVLEAIPEVGAPLEGAPRASYRRLAATLSRTNV